MQSVTLITMTNFDIRDLREIFNHKYRTHIMTATGSQYLQIQTSIGPPSFVDIDPYENTDELKDYYQDVELFNTDLRDFLQNGGFFCQIRFNDYQLVRNVVFLIIKHLIKKENMGFVDTGGDVLPNFYDFVNMISNNPEWDWRVD